MESGEFLCGCGRKQFHYYCMQKKCKSQNRRFCDKCMMNHQDHKRWAIFNNLNISVPPNMKYLLDFVISDLNCLKDKIIQDIRVKEYQTIKKGQNNYKQLLAYFEEVKQKIKQAIEKHLLNDVLTLYQNQSGPQLSWKIVNMINDCYAHQTQIFQLIEKAQQLQKFYDQKNIKLDVKEKHMQDIIIGNLNKFRHKLMELLQDNQLLDIQIQKLKSLSPFCDEFTQMIEFSQLKNRSGQQYANKKKLLMKWTKEVQIFEKTHKKIQQIPLPQSGQQQIERMIEMKTKKQHQHLNQQKKSWIGYYKQLLYRYKKILVLKKQRPTSNDYFDILLKIQPKFLEMKKNTCFKTNSVLFEKCKYQSFLLMADDSIKFTVKRENNNLSPASVFCLFDKLLSQNNPYIAINLAESIINEPITQKEVEQNQKIRVRLLEITQQNPDSIQNCILVLAKFLQSQNQNVFISPKSTARSQLTIRALASGFLSNYVICQQIIDDQDEECPYSFRQLIKNPQYLYNFEVWYRLKIQRDTGIDGSKIVFLRISRGSIKVQFATSQNDKLLSILKKKPELRKKIKLHSFFKQFQLSPQDFDIRGNIDYTSHKTLIDQRGGWPYYLPTKCKRYGINILDKFGKDNDWLQMDSNPNQWAVGFHGVRNPNEKIKIYHQNKQQEKIKLNNIIQGRKTGQMLIVIKKNDKHIKGAGDNLHYYQSSRPVNYSHSNQKIGYGVYFSPHIYVSLTQYTTSVKVSDKSQSYRLVFQSRLNPQKIKVCSKQYYWVVNNSRDIRPYGIILTKESEIQKYPKPQDQFQKLFTYEDYKDKIIQFLQSQWRILT